MADEPTATTSNQSFILLINGPNLNLLGAREPEKYGSTTLPQLENLVKDRCSSHSLQLKAFQSNHEGAILDQIHAVRDYKCIGIIINAGAYTHTSVAIRDALLGVNVSFIEVHITNVHKREAFRHVSYLSDKAEAVICGLGIQGYLAAVDWFAERAGKGS